MTLASFNKYVDLIDWRLSKYAASVSIRLAIGMSRTEDFVFLPLLRKYTKLLHGYDLVAEDLTGSYPENYLTPTQMQKLSEWAHKLLGIQLNIDFVLTGSDVYPAPPDVPTYTGDTKYVSITTNNTILQ